MEKTEDTSESSEFKIILTDIVQKKMCRGAHQDTILIVLQEVMEFVQGIIDQLEESMQSPAVSCASGCSFCCHSLIRIIPAEALLITAFIRQHFIDSDIQVLEKNIHAYQSLIEGKALKERVSIKDQTPCIFLKNNTCGIYPVRPFICRAWNSLDQSVCKSAFLSGNHNAEIETSPIRNHMFNAAKEIFQEMDNQMTLKTGSFEIPGAILDCLKHRDSLERWCVRQPVFTG